MPSHYYTLDDILQAEQPVGQAQIAPPVLPFGSTESFSPEPITESLVPESITDPTSGFSPRRQRRMEEDPQRTLRRFRRAGRTARGQGVKLGLRTLLDILASRGATDPQLLNRQLVQIQRGTESQQSGLEELMAARGLTGSGVGTALGAAVGQAGQERVSDALAREAALQEQRKRDDLDLILKLILGPRITRRGQDFQVKAAKAGRGGGAGGGLGDILSGSGDLIGAVVQVIKLLQ